MSNNLSGKAFAWDDYSSYATTADLIQDIPSDDGTATANPKYSNIANKYLFELDSTVLYNGHKTLKYNQPGGSDRSPGLTVQLFSPSRSKIWIKDIIKWSPGFTTMGTGYGSGGNSSGAGYKILGWPWGGGYNGRGTLDFANTNQYQISWDVRDPTTNVPIGPFTVTAVGSTVNEWNDGLWYQYIIYFEVLSPTQTRTRAWRGLADQVPTLRGTIGGDATVSGATVPNVNFVTIGMNYNQVRLANQNQALWSAQWEVIDGNVYPDPFGLLGTTGPVDPCDCV